MVRGSRFETNADILSNLSPCFQILFAGGNSPFEIDERPADFRRLLNIARGAETGFPDPSFERFLNRYQVVLDSSKQDWEEKEKDSSNELEKGICLDEYGGTNVSRLALAWWPIGVRIAMDQQIQRQGTYWPLTESIDFVRLLLKPQAYIIKWTDVFNISEPFAQDGHIWIVREFRLRFRLALIDKGVSTKEGFSRANAVARTITCAKLESSAERMDVVYGEFLAMQLMLQDSANLQDFRDLDEFEIPLPFWQRTSNSCAVTFLPVSNNTLMSSLILSRCSDSPFTMQNLSLLVDLELVRDPSKTPGVMFYPCLQWQTSHFSNFTCRISSEQEYETRLPWNHQLHRLILCAWNRTTRQLLRLREVQLKTRSRVFMRCNERDMLEKMNDKEGSTTRLPVYSLRAPGPGLSSSRIDDLRICVRLRDPNPVDEIALWVSPQTMNVGLFCKSPVFNFTRVLMSG